MGDFYEMFWEDAKTAARVLNITLTSRDKNSENPIPMAGVPFHSIESYLKRLIRAGHRVALAEQMEDPKLAKGVVKRDVTRLITPGTLTDDSFLDGRTDNFLAAVSFVMTKKNGQRAGVAWMELSTGACWATSGNEDDVLEQLTRLQPAEVLVPESSTGTAHPFAARLESIQLGLISTRPGWQHTQHHALEQIKRQWRVNTCAGFGFDDDDAGIVSVGALLAYLEETQKSAVGHIKPPKLHRDADHLLIDSQTYRSLEIERTTRSNSFEGSLLGAIDQTRTTMGGRLLRQWLRFPLADIEHIRARQQAIGALLESTRHRQKIVDALDGVSDIERIVARLSVNRAGPRDLYALSTTLESLPKMLTELGAMTDFNSIAPELIELCPFCTELGKLLAGAVRDDPPPHLRDGGVIADKYDPELDRLRALATDGQTWLTQFQAKCVAQSGINSLKVAYNKVFGYYIEVTDSHREKVPAAWIRRQTVKNAERYITEELKKFEDESLTARDRSIQLEAQLFESIRQKLLPELTKLQEMAGGIARLDVLTSLAQLASTQSYCRPEFVEDRILKIVDGRHLVLEMQMTGATRFVANDTTFAENDTVMLITGPNMAGKSTYIRQTALIALLAHVGSFVPAKSAQIGLCDRIFSRIGASDEIHTGQSTFMVEMTETANILNNSTDRSLVILDEIGRGTSTLDGLSLAWAITEHLASTSKSRTLFATHYHELTQLAEANIGVRNFNVAVREWEDQVIFLHRIVEGGTNRSYGIHVARLAGVPIEVLNRAKELLGQLAVHHVDAPTISPPKSKDQQQMMLFAYEPSGLMKELKKVELDELSPRDAHELIRKWKREFEE
ncbi:MAG TPA: DNA mismatch repair protein MutS, partial [Tepidisphaeraceae bacterium]|nr:DNA mismatch repair protein MutS [Tepidisphaeraceae bacterium]